MSAKSNTYHSVHTTRNALANILGHWREGRCVGIEGSQPLGLHRHGLHLHVCGCRAEVERKSKQSGNDFFFIYATGLLNNQQ